jgi:hypothetical protein
MGKELDLDNYVVGSNAGIRIRKHQREAGAILSSVRKVLQNTNYSEAPSVVQQVEIR